MLPTAKCIAPTFFPHMKAECALLTSATCNLKKKTLFLVHSFNIMFRLRSMLIPVNSLCNRIDILFSYAAKLSRKHHYHWPPVYLVPPLCPVTPYGQVKLHQWTMPWWKWHYQCVVSLIKKYRASPPNMGMCVYAMAHFRSTAYEWHGVNMRMQRLMYRVKLWAAGCHFLLFRILCTIQKTAWKVLL